ncbi:CPBP family intramembrane glutamic endopeptidase [Priestia taiwanensis]|uniref:CAAX prenyl protease 2/Lysostaphin resistance protein A-like domain-containing protein n=1 Tax=Priestia taiwanensis TaxID=1347902 RepID=A0A917EKT3_9BACI|nr:type II CAAX endopeptidase family protein [Priestia taiwanensis]MBM7361930.1 membrane protease YdiL (CAAX protease family) [Priestia taiwanensis]GGE58090.1 hypothetical protein GCM10007140_05560 [Priestia taiwanensis]
MNMNVSFESKIGASNLKMLVIYLFLFNSAWMLRELWLVQYIEPLSEVTATLLSACMKVIVWILPVWLYIKYYLHMNPIKYLKMDNVYKGVRFGLAFSLLLGLYFTFNVYIVNNQSFNFHLSLSNYINGILLVGITEEIVFRGFVLQELNKRLSFWKANVITSLLFLIIHYGIWLHDGVFFAIGSHIYIFLVGLFFGFVFKKSGSLWAVVILHSFHNLFVSMM